MILAALSSSFKVQDVGFLPCGAIPGLREGPSRVLATPAQGQALCRPTWVTSGAMAGRTDCRRRLQPAVHTVLRLTLVCCSPLPVPFPSKQDPYNCPSSPAGPREGGGISCDPVRWQDALETFLPLPVALDTGIKKWQLWETVLFFVFVFYSRWLPCQAPIVHIPPPSCQTFAHVCLLAQSLSHPETSCTITSSPLH